MIKIGDTNFALYMWYLVPGIIGAVIDDKNRVRGFFIGLGIALIGITVLAYYMGG